MFLAQFTHDIHQLQLYAATIVLFIWDILLNLVHTGNFQFLAIIFTN